MTDKQLYKAVCVVYTLNLCMGRGLENIWGGGQRELKRFLNQIHDQTRCGNANMSAPTTFTL